MCVCVFFWGGGSPYFDPSKIPTPPAPKSQIKKPGNQKLKAWKLRNANSPKCSKPVLRLQILLESVCTAWIDSRPSISLEVADQ